MVPRAGTRSVARPARERRLANRAVLPAPGFAAAFGRTSGGAAETSTKCWAPGELGNVPENVQAGGPEGYLPESRLARFLFQRGYTCAMAGLVPAIHVFVRCGP